VQDELPAACVVLARPTEIGVPGAVPDLEKLSASGAEGMVSEYTNKPANDKMSFTSILTT